MSITRVVMHHVSFSFLCCRLFVAMIDALHTVVSLNLLPIVLVGTLVGGRSICFFAGITIDAESDIEMFKQRRSFIIGVLVSFGLETDS